MHLGGILLDSDTHKRIFASVAIFFMTTVAVWLILRVRAGRDWDKKNFLDRMIVSLNSFRGGFLKIRTIFERNLTDVFINLVAVQKVRKAAARTTPDEPMLQIPKEDRWYILNFVLNAISEKFSDGLVKYDAKETLVPVKYLICLTCEAVGDDRIRKVRAMMIQKDVLLDLDSHIKKGVGLEQPWHVTRIDTLRHIAEVYKQAQALAAAAEPNDLDFFLELEIYV